MHGDKAKAALPLIVGARDEWLRDVGGKEYVDLCMGYGSVWLGHNNAAVRRAMVAQLERYSAPGYLPTEALQAVQAAMDPFLPETHFLGGIYSTGMEAVESALRAACVHTGRADIAGFAGSAHGRSFVTAAIGGEASARDPGFVHRLPSFAHTRTDRLERDLERLAERVPLAAVVVEPVQMTGGGHELSTASCKALFSVARNHSIPVLFDETLTGLYRCGARFYFDLVGQVPDILVIGKGMANGFPAAAVILRKGLAWDRARVRPGSTFWNHPLACAAAAATLDELSRLDAGRRVREIEGLIRSSLGALELRGRGAMWCLGCPDRERLASFAGMIFDAGIVVSYYDRYIRLLPPLTIGLDTLARACTAIKNAYADSIG